MSSRRLGWVLLGLVALLASPVHAESDDSVAARQSALSVFAASQPEFLPVDEAFVFLGDIDESGAVRIEWFMPEGYYLYRHQLKLSSEPDGLEFSELEIPDGKAKHDEFFGDVEVYYNSLVGRTRITNADQWAGQQVTVGITYQGCAEAGLCYPPETRWVRTQLAGDPIPANPGSATAAAAPLSEETRLGDLLAGSSVLYSMLVFLLAGVGLAFTPCVLPMVPILSSIIVGQGPDVTRWFAFTLSVAYVIGMALTYAVLGVLMGLFGASLNLQAALQSPMVLSVFAAVFAALSLSMFGLYELRLPAFLEQRLTEASQKISGGRHGSVVVMGALSALIVSPCVSAPLAAALVHISSTGDAILGGAALLSLGIGMGIPLLVVGTGGGELLPRAGAWMEAVKAVFGVGLLGMAIWLLERVVPGPVALLLWSLLFIGSGVYLGALDFSARSGWSQLWKATGVASLLCGILLLIGAASGASDPFQPLARLGSTSSGGAEAGHSELRFEAVADLDEVQAAVRAAAGRGEPAILDLYADWCISCKMMERHVFPEANVRAQMEQFVLLRADVTRNDTEDKRLLNHWGLFGPPSLLFFSPDGTEQKAYRIQGEVDAEQLAELLGQFLSEYGTS